MTYIFGGDISLNHGALVLLKTSPDLAQIDMLSPFGFSTVKGHCQSPVLRLRHLNIKSEDKESAQVERLELIRDWLEDYLDLGLTAPQPELPYIGLEGYAYGASHQAHQLGEVGGLVRLAACYPMRTYAGGNLRIHAPTVAKKFCTGNGKATKDEMIEAAQRQWGFPLPGIVEAFTHLPKKAQESLEDLTDAYALAMLVLTELRLRRGVVTLESLPQHQRDVFLAVSKSYPTNILAREWITGREDV